MVRAVSLTPPPAPPPPELLAVEVDPRAVIVPLNVNVEVALRITRPPPAPPFIAAVGSLPPAEPKVYTLAQPPPIQA
jgi:hypothetical protein